MSGKIGLFEHTRHLCFMRLACVEGKGRRGVFLVTQKMRASGVCMFWDKGEG